MSRNKKNAESPKKTRPRMRTTTPYAAQMQELLGGVRSGDVTLTHDEFQRVQRLYGFVPEAPNEKPAPPPAPQRKDFKDDWDFKRAMTDHETALQNLQNWTDPQGFLQAGADRNAFRAAESDGLRLLAWFAKYVEPGKDPLKSLVQLAVDAGFDVAYEDAEWAESEDDDV